MIPTFIGVTFLVFAIIRIVPGGPIEQMKLQAIAEEGHSFRSGTLTDELNKGELSEERLVELKKHYGITDSFFGDYFSWFSNMLQGNFGKSRRYGDSVWQVISSRMPISIFHGLLSMFFVYAICLPLGIVKAFRHRKLIDSFSSILVFLGYAIPGYALGSLLLTYTSVNWELFPLRGFVSDDFIYLSFWGKVRDLISHSFLPMLCYLVGSFAFMTMLVKNSMMDNLTADYMRTVIAKGQGYKKAIFTHCFDNCLIPIATTFGNNITLIIGGSFLIEKVFNIDGIGLVGFNSIVERDYPVVMGVLVISTILQLLGNLLSDICVVYVDPRVKF